MFVPFFEQRINIAFLLGLELPCLYFTSSISVLEVLLRTAGLPVLGLSSKLAT